MFEKVDASSSMSTRSDGQNKIQAANSCAGAWRQTGYDEPGRVA